MSKDELHKGELLRCFFSECEKHFRFLEQRYDYSFFYGLVEYRNNYKVIRPFFEDDVSHPFTAVTRYEKDDQALEILFGSDQYYIEGYAYYSPIDRFEFSEILTAAKKPGVSVAENWGLKSEALIENTISTMAHNVEKSAKLLLKPKQKLLDRAITMRHARLEHAIRQLHIEGLQAACEAAAKAFREKNYKLVIELLEPHRRYLKKADLKKLDRAKKTLLS